MRGADPHFVASPRSRATRAPYESMGWRHFLSRKLVRFYLISASFALPQHDLTSRSQASIGSVGLDKLARPLGLTEHVSYLDQRNGACRGDASATRVESG